jgi:Asp-tRNA(Asn)/Glu-tRNA(Gln) amidotransferase A subunit family amidase
LILTPTTRGHVPTIEGEGRVDGEETADWVAFTMGINMTRNPAGTLPIGLAADGMPLGLQIIGRQRDDFGVLDAMLGMERVFDFNERASFPNG